MAAGNLALLAFNRGLLSPLGLARTDLKRAALAAQTQTNWMPRVLGSMMLRPGKAFLGSTNNNARSKFLPFIFGSADTALLELTDSTFRPWVNEAPITRVSVATVIANGTFPTDLSSWTGADEAGAVSMWVAPGLMQLTGTGFNLAKRFQSVTVANPDLGKEHALRIVVAQETVTLRVGISAGDDSYIPERTLGTGTHSIAFTPAGPFFVQFANNVNVNAWVKSVAIEGPGVVSLPTPWPLAVLNPNLLRWDQSGDIVYVACDGFQQRKIKRTQGSTNPRSWSIELYQPKDGPFLNENTGPITLTPSGTTGAITLTASEPFFRSGHAGALFRIASIGQNVTANVSGTQQFTAPIKVTGVGGSRQFSIFITGTWVGTVTIQRSIGAIGAWSDVSGENWASNVSTTYLDALDNSIIFYRLGFDATYTSGTATVQLAFSGGTITGICRVSGIVSATVANANVQTNPGDTGVLQGLGSTSASSNWWEGQWSTSRGFPTSCALLEGRLWWAGRNGIVGSVSDAFESFDEITNIGDSGPINRTIGSGPVDVINWILPLQRMVLGTQGSEKSARSSSFDSPLTPTDFILKDAGTQGSAAMAPVKIDVNGVFVQKSGLRVYQLAYSPNYLMMDYSLKDLTNFCPDIALAENGIALSPPGFAGIVGQRQPDTRVHGWLNDGTARVLITDPLEDEQAWIKVQTAGTLAGAGVIEDAVVLPGMVEDFVYYVVRRVVNGLTVRYLEKWAREDECWGAPVSKCADAHIVYSGPAVTAIGGLSHLEGETVVCWGWNTITPFIDTMGNTVGRDLGAFTVTGGQITGLSSAVTNACVGLSYTAQFRSAKLAFAAQLGTALTQAKKIAQLAVILQNAHAQGLKYGPDFNTLRSLPLVTDGKTIDPNTVYTAYDQQSFDVPGKWNTDARLCLQAQSPRPVTCLAAIITMETREAA
jgi:hypothetical protein